jgi:PAS domain S-box-containing protein
MNISRRMTLSILVVLVVVCTAAMTAHYRLMLQNQKQELESLGSTVGSVIEESLAYYMVTRDEDVLDKTIGNLSTVKPITRILLLNNENVVMAGTDRSAEGKTLQLVDSRGAPVLAAGRGILSPEAETYRWVQGVRNRSECHGCHSAGSRYNGSIVIDFSTAAMTYTTRQHVMRESVIFLSAFSVVGLAAFLLSNAIVIVPLNRAIASLKRFKEGDASVRLPVWRNDEIARLGQGFNEMADVITASQQELERYARELLALAASSHVVTAVPRTENLADAVCNIAVRELKITMAWLGFSAKGGSLDHAAHCSIGAGSVSGTLPAADPVLQELGPLAFAARKKVPQLVNDIPAEPGYTAWRDAAVKRGYHAALALPLLSSTADVLGILVLYSDRPGYFTHKRLRMFMIFSNQVSTEIENRRLMENVERSKEELARQFDLLCHSQKEWQTTFDSITDLVSIHDSQFRIIKANKAVAEHFGLPPEAVVHMKCHDLFHDNCSIPGNCPHTKSMHDNRAVTEEVRDARTGKLFRVSTFPYYSPEGAFAGSVHVARDITQEKETEMRLIMSERLASLGQMASGLAHEINTPLASIAGCAEGLLMKVRNGRYEPQLFEEYLLIVEEEILRCKSITTGMLSFVRTSTYEQRDVAVNEALDKTLEIIGFQGRLRDVRIARRYQPYLPAVHGSEGELRQVFLAILINALDAMEDRGALTLETGSAGSSVVIRITDSGPGIDQENISRIFDPFFTTKSERGGTGLGLSVAYKIITNHQGSLDASSARGRGATFTITLPVPVDSESMSLAMR